MLLLFLLLLATTAIAEPIDPSDIRMIDGIRSGSTTNSRMSGWWDLMRQKPAEPNAAQRQS
jgi:hypothetical protein